MIRHSGRAGAAGRTRRILLMRGGLVLAAVALGFSLAEMALRLRSTRPRDGGADMVDLGGYWVHHPHVRLAFQNESGDTLAFITDEFGLRNEAGHARSGSPAERVLVLGDSYVEGATTLPGQLFTDDLERDLHERGQTGRVVVNAGLGGYGNVQSLLLLDHLWPVLEPATVVLMVCLNNDLHDDFAISDRIRARIAAVAAQPASPAGESGAAAREPGAAAASARNDSPVAELRHLVAQSRVVQAVYQARHRGIWADYFVFEMESYRRRPRPEVVRAVESIREIMSAFAAFSEKRGLTLVVCGIPSKASVYRQLSFIEKAESSPGSADRLVGLLRDPGGYDFDLPSRHYREACEAAGVRYVDLTPLFREHASEPLYGQIDRHWTGTAEALAADRVAEVLVTDAVSGANGMPPSGQPAPGPR